MLRRAPVRIHFTAPSLNSSETKTSMPATISPGHPRESRSTGVTCMAPRSAVPFCDNRLFAFGAYQGVDKLIGVTRISTIPTVDERKGVFTGVSHIYNPLTTRVVSGKYVRDEFPKDVINIPFDPAAEALLARYPTPTDLSAKANNYSRTANDSDHQNQFDVRFDGVFKERDHAFGQVFLLSETRNSPSPLT